MSAIHSDSDYAYLGRIIRLTVPDYARWQRSFSNLELMGALQARDDWLSQLPDHDNRRKNWFMATSLWLFKQNQAARPQVAAHQFNPDSF